MEVGCKHALLCSNITLSNVLIKLAFRRNWCVESIIIKIVMSENFPTYMGGSWKCLIYSPQAAQLTLCTHANVKIQSYSVLCIILLTLFLGCPKVWGLWIDAWHCPLCICDLRFVIKGNNGSPLGLVIYNGWFNLFHFYLVNCKLIIKIWILICH